MTLSSAALLCALALAAGSAAAQGTAEKRYPLPGHGALVLKVPSEWKEEVTGRSESLPPTIFYTPGGKKQSQVKLTPIWRASPEVPPFTKDTLRQNVEQGIKTVKPQALEKDIRAVEFQGASGPGYYFDATDKAPRPGEQKYLRSGMLKVGELLLAFTILLDDPNEPLMQQSMDLLQGAAHAPK